MNYGKNEVEKTLCKTNSRAQKITSHLVLLLTKIILILVLFAAVLGISFGYGIFKGVIDAAPEIDVASIEPSGYATMVYDSKGNLTETLVKSGANRLEASYEELPQCLIDAFVAIEDSRFWSHKGVDVRSMVRAAVGIITGDSSAGGGSTLTQQLIKNNVFPNFVNETNSERFERKIQEQYLALKIEKQMSKKEILEAYMNTINLGQGCLGVQTAAKRYFNKDAADLTLSECAVIAGITQSPSGNDPVKHPDVNARRREKVLNNMKKLGFINQTEYDEAMADNVYDRILETASNTQTSKPYSYFVDALIKQIVKDLVNKKGYSETQAYNLLYSGGLTITATQDADIQSICDGEVANVDNYLAGSEWGLDYALTVHHTDGTSENYSKEQLAAYISSTTGDQYPLVFSTQDAAQNAINNYKSTPTIFSAKTQSCWFVVVV